jgi:kinesin family protein 5
MSEIFVLNKNV